MLFQKGGFALPATTLASTTSQVIDLLGLDMVGLQLNYANATTAAVGFEPADVDVADNTVTVVGHGQVTGVKGQMTAATTILDPLVAVTDYFLIVIDADTFKFASSLANAAAGTAIDLIDAGTGTQTFTPTTSAGNVIKAQASLDGVGWTDITPTNFPGLPTATVTVATTTGSIVWDLQRPMFRYVNILYTPSAGQITFSVQIYGKIDEN